MVNKHNHYRIKAQANKKFKTRTAIKRHKAEIIIGVAGLASLLFLKGLLIGVILGSRRK